MNFCFCTDLHGSISKYEAIFNFVLENNIKLIHLGADILPKGSNIFEIQKKFINGYLKEFYQEAKEKSIDIIAAFGNDDLYSRKKYFRKYASLLDEMPYYKDGYEFKSYNTVPDYPFGLKTACKLDHEGWTCSEPYISIPVEDTNQGFVEIKNPMEYFLKKGTIEEDLNKIQASNKTIMAIHSPPYSLGLDVCMGGRRVGSKAVYDFIKKTQPLLCLSGHIHESPDVSKIWKAYIGKTLVIQPGQPTNKTAIVVIEIDDRIDAKLVYLEEK